MKKDLKNEAIRKARSKKSLDELTEEDLDLPMNPQEFYLAAKGFRRGCVVSIEILTRFYKWFQTHAKKEPLFQDYREFLLSIRVAKEQPIRPNAQDSKSQLKALSDAFENMDEYVERELAKNVARQIVKNYKELRDEQCRMLPSYKPKRDRLVGFMENPAEIFDLVTEIYEESRNISFETTLKKTAKKTIARDKAMTVVQILLDNWRHLQREAPVGHPGTASTSPFTELVRIAFDAIGYPSEDPTRLIKECINDPRRDKRFGFGPIDYWDI